jgi:histone H3/H4
VKKTKNKEILPLASMEKLLLKSGSNRVSENAKTALREALQDYAYELGTRANKFTTHAGRKTTRAEDIILAIKHKDA